MVQNHSRSVQTLASIQARKRAHASLAGLLCWKKLKLTIHFLGILNINYQRRTHSHSPADVLIAGVDHKPSYSQGRHWQSNWLGWVEVTSDISQGHSWRLHCREGSSLGDACARIVSQSLLQTVLIQSTSASNSCATVAALTSDLCGRVLCRRDCIRSGDSCPTWYGTFVIFLLYTLSSLAGSRQPPSCMEAFCSARLALATVSAKMTDSAAWLHCLPAAQRAIVWLA